jgi:hypothetical protein
MVAMPFALKEKSAHLQCPRHPSIVGATLTAAISTAPLLFISWNILYYVIPRASFIGRDLPHPIDNWGMSPSLVWCSDFVVLHPKVALALFFAAFGADIIACLASGHREGRAVIARCVVVAGLWFSTFAAMSDVAEYAFWLAIVPR